MIGIAINVCCVALFIDAFLDSRRENGLRKSIATTGRTISYRVYALIAVLTLFLIWISALIVFDWAQGISLLFIPWVMTLPTTAVVLWPLCARYFTIELNTAHLKYAIVSSILLILAVGYVFFYAVGCKDAIGACIPVL